MIFRILLPVTALLMTNVSWAASATTLTARAAIREIQYSLFNGESQLEGRGEYGSCTMTIEALEGRFPGVSVTISEPNRKPIVVEITSPNAKVERTRVQYLTEYKIINNSGDYPEWIFIRGFEDIGDFNLTLVDGRANLSTCFFRE